MSIANPASSLVSSVPAAPGVDARIAGLDGLRGFMTIVVLISHYFGELPGGFRAVMLGWLAVDVFFVLSGFLVGRLIIDKGDRENFLKVFYLRRVCRTFPIYFTCVLGAYALLSWQPAQWSDMQQALPFWTYLTFTQNIAFAQTTSIGVHWLSPTWTMAVEEQFYLLAPAVMLLTPARRIAGVLLAIALGAMAYRWICHAADAPPFYAMALLPARADTLALGLLAAVVFVRGWFATARDVIVLRLAVPALMAIAIGVRLIEGANGVWFSSVGFFLIACAAALYVLVIARGAPEQATYENGFLKFFGHNSFAIYLTHMPVLWLAHGYLRAQKPSIETWEGLAVSLLCVPICIALSRVLTRAVEEPFTAFGRSFAWSPKR